MKGIQRSVTVARTGVDVDGGTLASRRCSAAYGSPSVAPVNVEPPTVTGTALWARH